MQAITYPDWYGVEIVWSENERMAWVAGHTYVPMLPEFGDPVKDLVWERIRPPHIEEYERCYGGAKN